jgi:hypothetical protein
MNFDFYANKLKFGIWKERLLKKNILKATFIKDDPNGVKVGYADCYSKGPGQKV